MDYCCDRFKMRAEVSSEMGLNIRIVKHKPEDLLDTNHLYRFYITPGYTKNTKPVVVMNIANCPFCGTNLFQYYKSDSYINESDLSFLFSENL